MPKFSTNLDQLAAYEKLKAYFQNHQPFRDLHIEIEEVFDDLKKTLVIKGSGLNGLLEVHDHEVFYQLKLGLLLKPFQSKADEKIQKTLQRIYSP